MTIILYLDYYSQPSRSVLALCLATNIPHKIVEVDVVSREVKSAEFARINPLKKVPAIHDTENDLYLAESHTILRYLCLKFDLPEQWYPRSDLSRHAKLNEFLDYHHLGTRKCASLVSNVIFLPHKKYFAYGDPTFN